MSTVSALVIGAGSIGERHLRSFQAIKLYSVFACEPNAELGRVIAEKYGCEVFPSVEAAIASRTFDVAFICTPANTHIPIAKICIEAGLHVLNEKPPALSPDGLSQLRLQEEINRTKTRLATLKDGIQSMKANRAALESIRSAGEIVVS